VDLDGRAPTRNGAFYEIFDIEALAQKLKDIVGMFGMTMSDDFSTTLAHAIGFVTSVNNFLLMMGFNENDFQSLWETFTIKRTNIMGVEFGELTFWGRRYGATNKKQYTLHYAMGTVNDVSDAARRVLRATIDPAKDDLKTIISFMLGFVPGDTGNLLGTLETVIDVVSDNVEYISIYLAAFLSDVVDSALGEYGDKIRNRIIFIPYLMYETDFRARLSSIASSGTQIIYNFLWFL